MFGTTLNQQPCKIVFSVSLYSLLYASICKLNQGRLSLLEFDNCDASQYFILTYVIHDYAHCFWIISSPHFFQADHQAVLEQTMARHKEVTIAAISSLQDRMQPPGPVSRLVVVCMLFV